ncbi:MAG TPA: hypothetical protein VMQ65_07045 [Candidatus Limnocylindria bacterium]|nr:hypothetical protein [Candidatus Limnocylindria bacterium]
MTAFTLPEIDRSTLDELKKRFPSLSEIELPKMENVGKSADEAVDRLLGRSKAPVWPWIATGIGLVAVIGAIAAYFAWFRRPTWESPTDWSADNAATEPEGSLESDAMADSTIGNRGLGSESQFDATRSPVEEA